MNLTSLIIRAALIGVLGSAFTGCETTGDPTQGGLFAWSPSMADQRSAAYRARLRNEDDRLHAEETEAVRLQRKQKRLATSIDNANAELSLLLLDVRTIEGNGGAAIASKASAVRADIERAKGSSDPDEKQVRQMREAVNSLREELHLLQQRQ
jgi:hypothetical protein